MISFFMEIKTCIQQVCITLIKHDSLDIYNVTKDFKISSKCCYELCIHQIILKSVMVSTNTLSNCFRHINNINKKYFLSSKLAY